METSLSAAKTTTSTMHESYAPSEEEMVVAWDDTLCRFLDPVADAETLLSPSSPTTVTLWSCSFESRWPGTKSGWAGAEPYTMLTKRVVSRMTCQDDARQAGSKGGTPRAWSDDDRRRGDEHARAPVALDHARGDDTDDSRVPALAGR